MLPLLSHTATLAQRSARNLGFLLHGARWCQAGPAPGCGARAAGATDFRGDGDRYTNSRRIFIVGIKREHLRGGVDPGTVDLFPPGLESILDPAAAGDLSLRFGELERLRPPPPEVYYWDTTVYVWLQRLVVRTRLVTTYTTQQAPLQPSELTVTGQASRRAYIGSMESVDVCHGERRLEPIRSPNRRSMRWNNLPHPPPPISHCERRNYSAS